MVGESFKLNDVFGINRGLPANYQERASADTIFRDSLTREQHLVIYGSSKQGKTCLRKHCLDKDSHIVVQCSNKWGISDLHSAILKRAGFEITQSTTKSSGGKQKVCASLGARIFTVGAEGAANIEKTFPGAVTIFKHGPAGLI